MGIELTSDLMYKEIVDKNNKGEWFYVGQVRDMCLQDASVYVRRGKGDERNLHRNDLSSSAIGFPAHEFKVGFNWCPEARKEYLAKQIVPLEEKRRTHRIDSEEYNLLQQLNMELKGTLAA